MNRPGEKPTAQRLEFAEAVHEVARRIPAGRVLSYGDIAELLGVAGARQVGKAMHHGPAGTPWWRVIRADGTIAGPLLAAAQSAWQAEDTPRRGTRVDMKRARWQPDDHSWLAIQALSRSVQNTQTSVRNDEMES